MVYALDESGIKIEAGKGRRGVCPLCGDPLQAKCGEIIAWHWAHHRRLECDPWYECETEWHLKWKRLAPPERVEVSMGEHRADIIAVDGAVLELQHSDISVDEVRARERFYGKMLWLLDGSRFQDNIRVEVGKQVRFTWSPPRPTWRHSRAPKFIHGFTIGNYIRGINPITKKVEPVWKPIASSNDILQILTLDRSRRMSGTARIIEVEKFCRKVISEGALV